MAEVAIHGLDMADALGREPWLTVEAGAAVPALLFGPDQVDVARELTWDRPPFLREVTGRAALDTAETAAGRAARRDEQG